MPTSYTNRTVPSTSYTNRTKPTTNNGGTVIDAGMPIGLLLALTYATQITVTAAQLSPSYTNRTKPTTTYTNRTQP